LVQKLDAGGVIPPWLVDSKVPHVLSVVQNATNEFRQDEKVDAAERRELAILMREAWEDEVYSEDEVREQDDGQLSI
jgi:hypothetical protein